MAACFSCMTVSPKSLPVKILACAYKMHLFIKSYAALSCLLPQTFDCSASMEETMPSQWNTKEQPKMGFTETFI